MAILGTTLYVSVLLINALAVLNEERFLARIGWSSVPQVQTANSGFNQSYDQNGYGTYQQQQDAGLKSRLVELVTAVRTLMRIPLIVINILIIMYALVLG